MPLFPFASLLASCGVGRLRCWHSDGASASVPGAAGSVPWTSASSWRLAGTSYFGEHGRARPPADVPGTFPTPVEVPSRPTAPPQGGSQGRDRPGRQDANRRDRRGRGSRRRRHPRSGRDCGDGAGDGGHHGRRRRVRQDGEAGRAQGGHPGGRARHPVPAGHQGAAQGDAAGRRQAGHPVRRRGGGAGRASTTSSSSPAAASASLEDHFDRTFELEYYLEAKGKHDELEGDRGAIAELADIHYVRQGEPLGPRPRRLGRPQARRRRAVRGPARRRPHGSTSRSVLDGDDRRLRALRAVGGRAHGVPARGDLGLRLRAARGGRRRRSSASSTSSRSPRRRRRRRTWPSWAATSSRPRSSTRSSRCSRAWAARSSSPTPSRCCSHEQTVYGYPFERRAATTSARSSTTCGPRSSWPSTATTSGPSSAPSSPTSSQRKELV